MLSANLAVPSHESTGSQDDPAIAIGNHPTGSTERNNPLKPPANSAHEILDAIAAQQRQGETSLIVTIKPGLLQEAMNALHDNQKLFAPVVPGATDPTPIYAVYEQMRQVNAGEHTTLVLVECQSIEEYREALARPPIRHSSDWRHLDPEWRALNKGQ